MKTLTLALVLVLSPVGKQQVPASTTSGAADQKTNSTANGTVKDKAAHAEQGTTGPDYDQHAAAGTPKPLSVPPRPRWSEHPWRRLMSLSDTDKIAVALFGRTTLYLVATVGILLTMVISQRAAALDGLHERILQNVFREGAITEPSFQEREKLPVTVDQAFRDGGFRMNGGNRFLLWRRSWLYGHGGALGRG